MDGASAGVGAGVGASWVWRGVDGGRGTAARTRVHILSGEGSETWGTVGVSDNIIEASWMALVDSLEFRATKR